MCYHYSFAYRNFSKKSWNALNDVRTGLLVWILLMLTLHTLNAQGVDNFETFHKICNRKQHIQHTGDFNVKFTHPNEYHSFFSQYVALLSNKTLFYLDLCINRINYIATNKHICIHAGQLFSLSLFLNILHVFTLFTFNVYGLVCDCYVHVELLCSWVIVINPLVTDRFFRYLQSISMKVKPLPSSWVAN